MEINLVRPQRRRLWLSLVLAACACSGVIGESDNAGNAHNAPGPGGTSVGGPGTGAPGNPGAPGGPASPAGPMSPGTPPPGLAPLPTCGSVDTAFAPLRRLTRDQWANAIRDLLTLTARPSSSALSPDETVGAFRSNTVSAATDLMITQYMEEADRVVRANVTRLEGLVPCDRAATGDDACATQFIDRFGLRAYRRPLAADEKTRYSALYNAYKAAGVAEGLRMVVTTMLQSAHFLYHVEFNDPVPGSATGAVVPLGPYALASRLSFLLWDSIPDAALFDAAATGKLNTPEGLRLNVERMLKDAKARDAISSFHLQWLDIDDITSMGKDTKVFATYTTALRDAMRAETVNFVDAVVRRGNAKLDTLLTSSSSTIDGGLFALYGVERPANFVAGALVPLDATQRAGLLTHASVLAVHAHANQSSPVARGVLIRKHLLCQDLPDPPPNVNSTPPDPKPDLTTRERFGEHKKNTACAGCHKLIDDVGFGFERYDGIGAYRATENNKPVDASGVVVATRDIDGPFNGAVELAKKLAASKEVEECMARQWFRFSLGRYEGAADKCALERVSAEFANAGRDIRALVASIVASDPFRFRRTMPAAP